MHLAENGLVRLHFVKRVKLGTDITRELLRKLPSPTSFGVSTIPKQKILKPETALK